MNVTARRTGYGGHAGNTAFCLRPGDIYGQALEFMQGEKIRQKREGKMYVRKNTAHSGKPQVDGGPQAELLRCVHPVSSSESSRGSREDSWSTQAPARPRALLSFYTRHCFRIDEYNQYLPLADAVNSLGSSRWKDQSFV